MTKGVGGGGREGRERLGDRAGGWGGGGGYTIPPALKRRKKMAPFDWPCWQSSKFRSKAQGRCRLCRNLYIKTRVSQLQGSLRAGLQGLCTAIDRVNTVSRSFASSFTLYKQSASVDSSSVTEPLQEESES